MAVVVSLINMKGGVGKTTVASQLAHAAAADGLRILAVDLDPQIESEPQHFGARAVRATRQGEQTDGRSDSRGLHPGRWGNGWPNTDRRQ